MKSYKILLFLILLFTSACTKVFYIDLEERRQILVNALLAAGSRPVITVRYAHLLEDTMIYVSNSEMLIKDAFVQLSNSRGETYILEFTDSTTADMFLTYVVTGYTNDSLIIESGQTYYLTVYVKGYDTIRAQTTVPYEPNVDSIRYISGRPNFFRAALTIYDSCSKDFYWFYSHSFWGESPGFIVRLLPDTLFNCQRYDITFSCGEEKVRVAKVNEDFAKYYISMYQQIDNVELNDLPNPFYEPVVVYSNVENGLGIFCAMSKAVTLKFKVPGK